MYIFEVRSEEQMRVDLFLIRVMGKDTYSNRVLLGYFNPEVDFTNFVSGLRIKVPDKQTIKKFVVTGNYYIDKLGI